MEDRPNQEEQVATRPTNGEGDRKLTGRAKAMLSGIRRRLAGGTTSRGALEVLAGQNGGHGAGEDKDPVSDPYEELKKTIAERDEKNKQNAEFRKVLRNEPGAFPDPSHEGIIRTLQSSIDYAPTMGGYGAGLQPIDVEIFPGSEVAAFIARSGLELPKKAFLTANALAADLQANGETYKNDPAALQDYGPVMQNEGVRRVVQSALHAETPNWNEARLELTMNYGLELLDVQIANGDYPKPQASSMRDYKKELPIHRSDAEFYLQVVNNPNRAEFMQYALKYSPK